MKLPTIKFNDVKSEATITIPYELVKTYTEDDIRYMVINCLDDFFAASDINEQFH